MGLIGYDPMVLNVDLLLFNINVDWEVFYGNIEEELPQKIPESLGMDVSIYLFVGANLSGNIVKRLSLTGIITFIQNAPIIWFSKKHNTSKAATFVIELVALMICKYLIIELRYKLRMFGIRL